MDSRFQYHTLGRRAEAPSVQALCVPLTPADETTSCIDVLNQFLNDKTLKSLPVVDRDRAPVALVERAAFIEYFARPYAKDLHGGKAVIKLLLSAKSPFPDRRPLIVDEATSVDDIAQIIISHGIENMVTGLIVTRGGRYVGMANGEDLLSEITERTQADLYYAAHYDHLTGIPNRMLLVDRVRQACRESARKAGRVGLIFFDLDNFKEVNDSWGHGVGDKLLIQAGERLKECLRKEDTLGRMGGDEFAVLVTNLQKPEDITPIAQKILATLARPFDLDGHDTHVSASMGITIFPDDAQEVSELFKNADTAMYKAKEHGGNNYQFYLPAMNDRLTHRRNLEKRLRQALEKQEFELHYQPKASLNGGTLSGCEALLRWRDPERGLVPPVEFVPVLEETGLIVPVGDWVLQTVCAQIRRWKSAGIAAIPVAINISARQLQQKTIEGLIARVASTGIDPSLLKLELTESLLMKDVEETVRLLNRLKANGACLSVDDFGTGYSSLAYLKRLPIDEIKIDRSFIRDIASDPDDAEITLAIIGLAHSLSLTVVAEGVETEAQLSFLCAHGCDEIQGYYFARPIDSEECTALLASGHRLRMPALHESYADHPTILLLDDDRNDLELMRRALAPGGYQILATDTPQKAFELLAQQKIDIVISDHHIPRTTGVRFLARVRTLYPDALRIVMSGFSDLEIATGAVNEAGVHKYLFKNWDANRLLAEVREAHIQKKVWSSQPT